MKIENISFVSSTFKSKLRISMASNFDSSADVTALNTVTGDEVRVVDKPTIIGDEVEAENTQMSSSECICDFIRALSERDSMLNRSTILYLLDMLNRKLVLDKDDVHYIISNRYTFRLHDDSGFRELEFSNLSECVDQQLQWDGDCRYILGRAADTATDRNFEMIKAWFTAHPEFRAHQKNVLKYLINPKRYHIVKEMGYVMDDRLMYKNLKFFIAEYGSKVDDNNMYNAMLIATAILMLDELPDLVVTAKLKESLLDKLNKTPAGDPVKAILDDTFKRLLLVSSPAACPHV